MRERGGDGQSTAPFTGAITLTLSSPPTGVSAVPVTTMPGAGGTLFIRASAAAKVGKLNVTIAGAPPAGTTGVTSTGIPAAR